VQLFLLTKPKYKTELSAVWLARSEIPTKVRKRLCLPFTDEGIDLIAQTRDVALTEGGSEPANAYRKFRGHPDLADLFYPNQ